MSRLNPITKARLPPSRFMANFFQRQSSFVRSPKAGHNKAGWSDFRNQRFEPDTAKMWKIRKVPLTAEK